MTSTKELQEKLDFPPQGDWALDPVHTVAGFVGRYLMITKVLSLIHISEPTRPY